MIESSIIRFLLALLEPFVFGLVLAAVVVLFLKRHPIGRTWFSNEEIKFPVSCYSTAMLGTFIAQMALALLYFAIFLSGAGPSSCGPGKYTALISLFGGWLAFGALLSIIGLFGSATTSCVEGLLRHYKLSKFRSLICAAIVGVVYPIELVYSVAFSGTLFAVGEPLNFTTIAFQYIMFMVGALIFMALITQIEKRRLSGTTFKISASCLAVCLLVSPIILVVETLGGPQTWSLIQQKFSATTSSAPDVGNNPK